MVHHNRKKTPKLDNKEWLREQYVEKGLGGDIIAEKVSASRSTVYRRLQEHDFDMRDSGGKPKHTVLEDGFTWEHQQILYGELLGDGSLQVNPNGENAKYAMTTADEFYRDWIADFLRDCGLTVTTYEQELESYSNGVQYGVSSEVAPTLTRIHNQWYSDGQKIVPNIQLQPLVLRHWYIGDGQYTDEGAVLHTQGFAEQFTKRLQRQLDLIGIKVTVRKNGQLGVLARSSERFFNYMAQLPDDLEGFEYKWP